MTIRYRGGTECWYELSARGRVWMRPGVLALHDVMEDINGGVGGRIAPKKSDVDPAIRAARARLKRNQARPS